LEQSGKCDISNAATPATCEVAEDVPSSLKYNSPLALEVDVERTVLYYVMIARDDGWGEDEEKMRFYLPKTNIST
jgi:hypothetical protein